MSGEEKRPAHVERPETFPRSWGPPPPNLEARKAWILSNVMRSQDAQAANLRLRAVLLAKRYGPGE